MGAERRPDRSEISRRRALARLGLGAAIAYTAPTIVHLDRSANAKISLTPCDDGGAGGGRSRGHCKPDKADRKNHRYEARERVRGLVDSPKRHR